MGFCYGGGGGGGEGGLVTGGGGGVWGREALKASPFNH